jgi:hypothetical protein
MGGELKALISARGSLSLISKFEINFQSFGQSKRRVPTRGRAEFPVRGTKELGSLG